jgi:cation:H+ antiporter
VLVVVASAQVVAGLAILLVGAWLAVRSASALAALLGLSPVIIGATVVAFGTSAPEFLVSTLSAARGSPELAFGNAVGSNITNVALILGLSAVIVPLQIHERLLRWEMPVLLVATLAFMLFLANGTLGRLEGAAMFVALLTFLVLSFRLWPEAAAEAAAEGEIEAPRDIRGTLIHSGWLVLGIAGLAAGAEVLVRGATTMAESAGLSQLAIGATVVATGTSLPELATSAVAAWKKEDDIAVANVVGSNIFNLLAVLGLAATIAPLDVSRDVYSFEMPILLVSSLVLLPLAWRRFRIGRTEGALLFASYFVFTAAILARGGMT